MYVTFGIDMMIDNGDTQLGFGEEYFSGSETISSLRVDESYPLKSLVGVSVVTFVVVTLFKVHV
jgi:hypothetical protein